MKKLAFVALAAGLFSLGVAASQAADSANTNVLSLGNKSIVLAGFSADNSSSLLPVSKPFQVEIGASCGETGDSCKSKSDCCSGLTCSYSNGKKYCY
ncbi:hypothetical protein [uncultured Cohaesibacter sp.]|uniref:huwentoxin-IV family protein n=1 Tax=uncultured Cohaesibacter sp. TaxID=1002546 RepID=UPI00292E104B|nr:hypothetical protein [uncultured Cohaesibacter sp.]